MMKRTDVVQLPAFRGLAKQEVSVLRRHLDHIYLLDGQSVLLGSGLAEELLVVVEGRMQALGRLQWVAAPGEVLGAHALLTRGRQPHGFRAAGPALVAFAGVLQVRTLMARSPAFATAVAVSLCEQLSRHAIAAPNPVIETCAPTAPPIATGDA